MLRRIAPLFLALSLCGCSIQHSYLTSYPIPCCQATFAADREVRVFDYTNPTGKPILDLGGVVAMIYVGNEDDRREISRIIGITTDTSSSKMSQASHEIYLSIWPKAAGMVLQLKDLSLKDSAEEPIPISAIEQPSESLPSTDCRNAFKSGAHRKDETPVPLTFVSAPPFERTNSIPSNCIKLSIGGQGLSPKQTYKLFLGSLQQNGEVKPLPLLQLVPTTVTYMQYH